MRQHKIQSKSFVQKDNQFLLPCDAIQSDANGKWKLFDLSWEPVVGAKSYAMLIIDYEASRVIGQPFIHYAVCNLHQNEISFGENLSSHKWVEGVNSTVPSQQKDDKGVIISCLPEAFAAASHAHATGYFPPMPPDKKHLYTIKIFALDVENLPLHKGFYLGELNHAMLNHVLNVETLNFWYDPEGK